MAKGTIRQAGGIVFRGAGAKPRVLVVSTRRKRNRWVLPKGTVKWRESAEDAAVREVWEEAGVRGRVIAPAGTAEYSTKQGRVRIEYFLVKYTRRDENGGEDRETRWCAVEDAVALLTYASARRVLLEAYPKIVRRARDRRRQQQRRRRAATKRASATRR